MGENRESVRIAETLVKDDPNIVISIIFLFKYVPKINSNRQKFVEIRKQKNHSMAPESNLNSS